MPWDSIEHETAAGVTQQRNSSLTFQYPGATLGLAQGQDTLANSDNVSGMLMSQRLQGISQLPADKQATVVQGLSPEETQMLMAGGYKPTPDVIQNGQQQNPTPQHHGWGFWRVIDDAIGGVGKAVGWTMKEVGKVPIVGGVFKAVNAAAMAGMTVVGDAYRFGLLAAMKVLEPGKLGQMYTPDGTLDGAGFGQLFRASLHGDKLVWDHNIIQTSLDQTGKQIALDEAFGTSQDDLMKKYGAAAVDKAINDPGYNDFLARVNDEKLSPGRQAANLLGINRGHLFHIVSGLADAWVDKHAIDMLSPTKLISKGFQRFREAGYLASDADAIDRIVAGSAGARNLVSSVLSFNKPGGFDVSSFARQYPNLEPMASRFAEAAKHGNLNEVEDVINELKKAVAPIPESLGNASGVGLPSQGFLAQLNLTPGIFQGQQFMGLHALHDASVTLHQGAQDAISAARNWTVGVGVHEFKPLDKLGQMVQHLSTPTIQRDQRQKLDNGLPNPDHGQPLQINPYDPGGVNRLRAMVSMNPAMTPADVDEWMQRFYAADKLGQVRMYTSLGQQALEAGARIHGYTLSEVPDLARMSEKFAKQMDDFTSAEGIPVEDELNPILSQAAKIRDVGALGVGVETLTGKLWRNNLPVFDYREFVQGIRSMGWAHQHVGPIFDLADSFMEHWRTLNTVMKPFFGGKVGGEEAYLNIKRRGLMSHIRGTALDGIDKHARALDTLGKRALAAERDMGEGTLGLRDHIAQMWHQSFLKVDQALLSDPIEGIKDQYGRIVRRKVNSQLSEADWLNAATLKAKYAGDSMAPGMGGYDPTMEAAKAYKTAVLHDRSVIPENDLTPDIPGYADTTRPSLDTWRTDLVHSMNGPEWNAVKDLFAGDVRRRDLVADVADRLEELYRSDAYREAFPESPATTLHENFDVSVKKAAMQSSKQLVNLVMGGDKRLLQPLIDEINNRAEAFAEMRSLHTGGFAGLTTNGESVVPPAEWFAHNLDPESLPRFVKEASRQSIPGVMGGHVASGAQRIYGAAGHIQERIINDLSRQGSHGYELAKALKETAPRYDALARAFGPDVAEKMWYDGANELALERQLKYVHNPGLRSQFSEWHRNTLPFWFAKQQFLERWGRAIKEDPGVLSDVLLDMHGLRATGIVHQDPQTGQEYFVMPGVQYVATVLKPVLKQILGVDIDPKALADFRTPVSALSAGLQEQGMSAFLPSPGPIVTMPLKAIASRIPEFQPILSSVAPFSQGQSLWQMAAPSWLTHAIQGMNANDQNKQFASALQDQIASMMSDPKTALPETGATPIQIEQFLDQARQRARGTLMLRAIGGFFGPGVPEYKHVNALHDEYQSLVRNAGSMDEAQKIFYQNHPNATPRDLLANAYATTFDTQLAARGSAVPPTQAVAQFLEQYPELPAKYGAAATFLLPYDKNGKFDQQAYNDEITSQLRIKRAATSDIRTGDTSGFMQQAYINRDAPLYYATEKLYLQRKDALVGTGDTLAQQALDESWKSFKNNYLASRPVFSAYVAMSAQRQQERQQTLVDLAQALEDPNTPDSGHKQAMTDMIRAYTNVLSVDQQYQGQRDTMSSQARKQATLQFVAYAEAATDPMAQMVYTALIRGLLNQSYVNG